MYVNLANVFFINLQLFLYSKEYDNARFYLKMVFNKDPQYLSALRSYLYLLFKEKKGQDAVNIFKTHTTES